MTRHSARLAVGEIPEPAGPDEREVALARLLESLANPTRLTLLRHVRSPRLLSEIRLRAEQARDGLNPNRPMARQGVRHHLDSLLESGFIRRRESWRGEQPVDEYLVNHQRLFAIAEDFRALAGLRPSDLSWDEQTATLDDGPARPHAPGPQLLIVHGLAEGHAFVLKEENGKSEWIVGRRPGLQISLDYDPFVSSEHARILREGDRFLVEDFPQSRNGTTLNWRMLPRGGRAELKHGNVVGVGRSLLLFWERGT